MTHATWHDVDVRSLQMIRTARDGSSVLLVINGALDPVEFVLPEGLPDATWHLAWDSTAEHPDLVGTNGEPRNAPPGTRLLVEALSMRVYTA
jgi:glycogen operon protein